MTTATRERGAVHEMDPRIGQRRAAVAEDHARRRRRKLVVAGSVVAAAVAAVAALHAPFLSARHVEVRGAVHTPTAAVVRVAGLGGDPPLVDVNPAAASSRLARLPWIRRATVQRRWPDTVVVTVVERTPVAALARPGGIALVDGTGRVLAWTTVAPPGVVALAAPVAAGTPGTRLAAADRPGLLVAATIPAVLVGRVRSVAVDDAGQVRLDLGGGLSALLGTADDLPAKWESLASVLAGANPTGALVIDVSVPGSPDVGPPVG